MSDADVLLFDFEAKRWDDSSTGQSSYTWGDRDAGDVLKVASKGAGLAALLRGLLPPKGVAPRLPAPAAPLRVQQPPRRAEAGSRVAVPPDPRQVLEQRVHALLRGLLQARRGVPGSPASSRRVSVGVGERTRPVPRTVGEYAAERGAVARKSTLEEGRQQELAARRWREDHDAERRTPIATGEERMVELGQYVKTTSEGNTFVLSLQRDGTVREWWEGTEASEGWDGTWSRISAPDGPRLRVRIGPFSTDFRSDDGQVTGVELDEHGHEHGTSTLTRGPRKNGDDAAFTRLLATAGAVAQELRDKGVPGDSYESQKTGGERPQASSPCGGWVVAGLDMEETYRGDLSGAIRNSRYESLRSEVWLLFDGQLKTVTLRNETVSNNLRGSGSNVVPTRIDVEDMTSEAARRWDSPNTWKTRERRGNGQVVLEEWRAFARNVDRPPCAELMSLLVALRGRGG
jgi:hypothetical protein